MKKVKAPSSHISIMTKNANDDEKGRKNTSINFVPFSSAAQACLICYELLLLIHAHFNFFHAETAPHTACASCPPPPKTLIWYVAIRRGIVSAHEADLLHSRVKVLASDNLRERKSTGGVTRRLPRFIPKDRK